MGISNWLAGDATDLGAQDRINESKKGIPLTNKWSAKTTGKFLFSNPASADNFSHTYRLGSEQQSQAIKNAKEFSNVISRENMMGYVQGIRYQAELLGRIAQKMTEFQNNIHTDYTSFVSDVNSLTAICVEFHPRLTAFKIGYEEQAKALSYTLRKHIDDFEAAESALIALANKQENKP